LSRICLDRLRARNSRREEPLGMHLPEPLVSRAGALDPEHEALLAVSLGLALLIVLDTLTPTERLAFVLHDVFSLLFEEIAPIMGRKVSAAGQLASRARRRLRERPALVTSIALVSAKLWRPSVYSYFSYSVS
jgi:DNA-directed RNA polymerase specialized sigma24 family protein